MLDAKLVTSVTAVLSLLGCCYADDLASLIDGVVASEEIAVDGVVQNWDSDLARVDHDEDGKLSVTFGGVGTVSVRRSTGLASSSADRLLEILERSLGSRYRLMATMKRGGRLLTYGDEKKLNRIIDDAKQNIELFINGERMDLSEAATVDGAARSPPLRPQATSGVGVTTSDDGIAVNLSSADSQVKIVVGRGLDKRQAEKVKANFYDMVAAKAGKVTSVPKQLIELTMAGREAIVDRLGFVLSPAERVVVGGVVVNLDSSETDSTSTGRVLRPSGLPHVKITWKKNEVLRVDSEDGQAVNVEYSKGVNDGLIGRIVDGLHRALTLRLSLISWSNKLLGTLPPRLKSALDELKNNIQERKIFVDDREIDLKVASVVNITRESVLYRLPDAVLLRVDFDGTVATIGGEKLSVELTPGVSESQAANIFSKMNEIFSTSVGFSTDSGEALLSYESNRNLLETLIRGIEPRETLKIDSETVRFSNATLSNARPDSDEYKVDNFDDVVLTRFSDGSVQALAKGRNVFVRRSTGLTLDFLNRLVSAIVDVMPKKRWFYDFGRKGVKRGGRRLRETVDEISTLVHKQTVTVQGKEIDLMKSYVVKVDDSSTVFRPEARWRATVTQYVNGDIRAAAEDGETIAVKVTAGITWRDAETLVTNIKKIVAGRIEIGVKRPQNLWCSSGHLRKLLNRLLKRSDPARKISGNSGDANSSSFSASSPQVVLGSHENAAVVVRGSEADRDTGYIESLGLELTPDLSNDLVQYLATLLDNKEDIIKMVTGSFPDYKRSEIKELVLKMVKTEIAESDSNFDGFSDGLTEEKTVDKVKFNGNVNKTNSGISMEQAQQLYANILSGFRETFSEMTNIPVELLDSLSGLKRFMMKSFFFSAAPPKEFLSLDGEEIRLKKSVNGEDGNSWILHGPENSSSVEIVKYQDGSLQVTSDGGNIDVIKTTGLDDDQVERILKAVEYRLGIRNKMFRILPDKLITAADTYDSVRSVLTSYISTIELYTDGIKVEMKNMQKMRTHQGCTLYKFDEDADLMVKRCDDGRISVNNKRGKRVGLHVLAGISSGQCRYILDSLVTTITTKSSQIKLLANFADTFFKLLADGRIKTLETLLTGLFPREDIVVDGTRIALDPFPLESDAEYSLLRPEASPGIEVNRFKNGSVEVKSRDGGRLDVSFNSGLTADLARALMERMKYDTARTVSPYLTLVQELLQSDASAIFNLFHHLIEYQNSGIDTELIVDLALKELKTRIGAADTDGHLYRNLLQNAEQRQEIFLDGLPVNLDGLSVVSGGDDFTVGSPYDKDYIKITRYDNGRLVVDSLKKQLVSARVSAGIPKKALSLLTNISGGLIDKFVADDNFSDRAMSKLLSYLDGLKQIVTAGIVKCRKITLDGQEIKLNDESSMESSYETPAYQDDGLSIGIEANGATRLEWNKAGRLELDISSGLMVDPVITFLSNNTLELTKELYLSYDHFETAAPLTTKLQLILSKLMESLKQDVVVNGRSLESGGAFRTLESNKEYRIVAAKQGQSFNLTVYKDGRLTINSDGTAPVSVRVTAALKSAHLDRLRSNVELLFSRLNPIQLFADFFDILPKNFFILAQNMDRVLSIMNLIKF